MKTKLFMLSSHGGWDDTFKANLGNYKDLCSEVAKGILAKLENNDTAYIGYDGDGYGTNTPPISYLFLKVIQILLEDKGNKNILVQPIVCQITGNWFPKDIRDTDIHNEIKNLYETYGDKLEDGSSFLTLYSEKLLKQIDLKYSENDGLNSEAINIVDGKSIEIHYGSSYIPRRIKDNFTGKNDFIKKIETVNNAVYQQKGNEKYTFEDNRSACYGGYTEVGEGEKKLVGSTAGWKVYLDKFKGNFDEIYYVPVWLKSVKKYEGSITHKITEVFNILPLGSKYAIMPFINDENGEPFNYYIITSQLPNDIRVIQRAGSRKSKTLKKKKSKKRKSKSRKPLSKTLKMRKRKRSQRKRK